MTAFFIYHDITLCKFLYLSGKVNQYGVIFIPDELMRR